MSKVILTQEQADAVKKLKGSIKANHEKFRSNHQCNLTDWEYVLLDIPTEEYLSAIFEGYEVESTFGSEEIKKEKRRRWWNNRHRDVWELHEGDVIKAKEDGLSFDVSSLNKDYLTELSIDELDERYLVICLAENREDVKDDE